MALWSEHPGKTRSQKEKYFDAMEKVLPPQRIYPVIPEHGGDQFWSKGVEQRWGAKFVFDASAATKPADVNNEIVRAARPIHLFRGPD